MLRTPAVAYPQTCLQLGDPREPQVHVQKMELPFLPQLSTLVSQIPSPPGHTDPTSVSETTEIQTSHVSCRLRWTYGQEVWGTHPKSPSRMGPRSFSIFVFLMVTRWLPHPQPYVCRPNSKSGKGQRCMSVETLSLKKIFPGTCHTLTPKVDFCL